MRHLLGGGGEEGDPGWAGRGDIRAAGIKGTPQAFVLSPTELSSAPQPHRCPQPKPGSELSTGTQVLLCPSSAQANGWKNPSPCQNTLKQFTFYFRP